MNAKVSETEGDLSGRVRAVVQTFGFGFPLEHIDRTHRARQIGTDWKRAKSNEWFPLCSNGMRQTQGIYRGDAQKTRTVYLFPKSSSKTQFDRQEKFHILGT